MKRLLVVVLVIAMSASAAAAATAWCIMDSGVRSRLNSSRAAPCQASRPGASRGWQKMAKSRGIS